MMGFFIYSRVFTEHLRGSGGKESACSVGDLGSIPGLGRSPGGENGYPREYSCLENPTDRGAWWATVPGGSESQTRPKRLTLPLGVKTCVSCWGHAKMRKPYLACALKKFHFSWENN